MEQATLSGTTFRARKKGPHRAGETPPILTGCVVQTAGTTATWGPVNAGDIVLRGTDGAGNTKRTADAFAAEFDRFAEFGDPFTVRRTDRDAGDETTFSARRVVEAGILDNGKPAAKDDVVVTETPGDTTYATAAFVAQFETVQ